MPIVEDPSLSVYLSALQTVFQEEERRRWPRSLWSGGGGCADVHTHTLTQPLLAVARLFLPNHPPAGPGAREVSVSE